MGNGATLEVKAVRPVVIFKEGFRLWVKNWRFMAIVYLLVNAPLTIISGLVVFKTEKMFYISSWLFGLLNWLLGSLVIASIIILIKEISLGKEIKVLGIFNTCIKRYLLRYLSATALYNIIVVAAIGLGALGSISLLLLALKSWGLILGGIIAFIVAAVFFVVAVYCGVRLSLCGFSCILDEAGAISSLKISHNLVKKHANPVIGEYFLLMLTGLISMIPIWSLGLLPQMPALAKPAVVIYTLFSSTVLTGISTCVLYTMYNKLKENN